LVLAVKLEYIVQFLASMKRNSPVPKFKAFNFNDDSKPVLSQALIPSPRKRLATVRLNKKKTQVKLEIKLEAFVKAEIKDEKVKPEPVPKPFHVAFRAPAFPLKDSDEFAFAQNTPNSPLRANENATAILPNKEILPLMEKNPTITFLSENDNEIALPIPKAKAK
jgi:hypothetical protein